MDTRAKQNNMHKQETNKCKKMLLCMRPLRVAYWTAKTAAHAAGVCSETADVDLTRVCFACPVNTHNNARTS